MSNDGPRLTPWRRGIGRQHLLAAGLLLAPAVSAHELAIDEVELHLSPTGGAVIGGVSFDPELAREISPSLAAGAGRLAVGFVERNLTVQINGSVSPCAIEVLELYVPGGAVPGDILDISCPVPKTGPVQVAVKLGQGWSEVAVQIAGSSLAGDPPGTPLILRGGEQSPVFSMHAPPGSVVPQPPAAASTGKPSVVDRASPLHPSLSQRLRRFAWMGFSHVIPVGLDHMLFVVGLVLGSVHALKRLLWQLSMFTAAHTVTLGLGAAGVPLLPAVLVEPLIALSVAWIAVENTLSLTRGKEASGSGWGRLWVVGLFGLIHGQGFSSVLFDIGFSRQDFWVPLLAINLGVELGHVLVAAATWILMRGAERWLASTRGLALVASTLIGLVGFGWAVERIASSLG